MYVRDEKIRLVSFSQGRSEPGDTSFCITMTTAKPAGNWWTQGYFDNCARVLKDRRMAEVPTPEGEELRKDLELVKRKNLSPAHVRDLLRTAYEAHKYDAKPLTARGTDRKSVV